MARFARIIALVFACIAGFAAIGYAAQTAPPTHRRTTGGDVRKLDVPIPQSTALSNAAQTRANDIPRMPPAPKDLATKRRRTLSVTGADIALTLGGTCIPAGNTGQTFYQAGCTLTWIASNLPGAATDIYQDYVLAPGNAGTTPTAVGAPYTTTTALSETQGAMTAGVYVFGSLNTSVVPKRWDALVYVLVGSPTNINTYNDSFLRVPAETFSASNASAATVFISTDSLTPTDRYVYTVENSGISGRCVFEAPASTTLGTSVCDASAANVTGQVASGGTFTTLWNPKLGTPAQLVAGTYNITLFDQTTGQRVASRQISLRDTAATSALTMSFVSGTGTMAVGNDPTVARVGWNGQNSTVSDPNVTYAQVDFGATGLPSTTDTYNFVLTDPNGHIVYSANKSGSTSFANTSNTYNLPNPAQPFELAYQSSTWIASVYDITTSTLLQSRAFRVLGYSASVQFNNPVGVGIQIASGSATTGIVYTNNANVIFNGVANADSLGQFVSVTTAFFAGVTVASTGCVASATACPYTATDSDGQTWNGNVICFGGCGGGAGSKIFVFTTTPAVVGQVLRPGAVLTLPQFTFSAVVGRCSGTTSCTISTLIYPQSAFEGPNGTNIGTTSNTQANNLYFSDAPGVTKAVTIDAQLVGYRDAGNVLHNNQSQPGYTPRFNHAILTNNQPFAQAGDKIVLALKFTNKSTLDASSVSGIGVALPAGFDVTTATVDAASPSGGAVSKVACSGGAPSTDVCLSGWTTLGTAATAPYPTQTVWLDLNPPSASFSYTDLTGLVYAENSSSCCLPYGISPGSTGLSTYVGSPASIDSSAIGTYSLNGSLMVASMTPNQVGTSTTNTLNYTIQNTPTSSDPFSDYLDFAALSVPNNSYFTVPAACSSVTMNTAGWSCLTSTTSGGKTTYYFGLCAAQIASLPTLPPNNTTVGSDNLPTCPSETAAIAPGSFLSASIPFTSGATVTPSAQTLTSYVHGATTDGWSTAIPTTVSVVNTVSAAAGFTAIGAYVAPPTQPGAIATGSQPTAGGDTNASGNSYIYSISNTGNAANPITAATITIPGKDTSGATGLDSGGVAWTVTSGITFVGGTNYGCSAVVTNPSPANGINTGTIALTGCTSFTNGKTIALQFSAQAPYTVNSTYAWPAVVNGATPAAENWYGDTTVKVALSATLVISIPTGAPAISCTPNPTSYNTATNTVDFGFVALNTNYTCSNAILVQVYTDAASPVGWKLYSSIDSNPARTAGPPNNQVLIQDSAAGNSSAGLTYTAAGFTVIPTASGSSGYQMAATSGSGTTATRGAFNTYTDVRISTGPTDPLSVYSQIIQFTWIGN
ncbi:MAG: hypothetical protein NVSMB64_16070 [Candidatus Velthaea sp.]